MSTMIAFLLYNHRLAVCVLYPHHDTRVRGVKSVGRATQGSVTKVHQRRYILGLGFWEVSLGHCLGQLETFQTFRLKAEKTTLNHPWREPEPANQPTSQPGDQVDQLTMAAQGSLQGWPLMEE